MKPRCDLGVIHVRVIAAARADEFERFGVAAFEAAVHDADRLAPHECRPAVTGLPGEREYHPDPRSIRSHGSGRSCRRGAGTAARPAPGPVPVTGSGSARLLTQLTARQ